MGQVRRSRWQVLMRSFEAGSRLKAWVTRYGSARLLFKLPARVFVWRDEFEDDYARDATALSMTPRT